MGIGWIYLPCFLMVATFTLGNSSHLAGFIISASLYSLFGGIGAKRRDRVF